MFIHSSQRNGLDVHGACLTRRQFVKSGGALIVGLAAADSLIWGGIAQAAIKDTGSLDPAAPDSWFVIQTDNTVLMRTGKVDFGQATVPVAYRQVVAEELRVAFEAITTVVSGDTDRTPDGGFSADYLHFGAVNLRKAAAYTYQALLALAAETLGVDKAQLSVSNGMVSGGGKSISYGDLVSGQELSLSIPVTGDLTSMFGLTVTGDPPLKPASEYSIIGKSYANPVTTAKVVGNEEWVTNVRLPNMLHGRVVHPKTLGSKLVSAGELDTAKFPTAKVVVRGNLVGVVASNEWEAIQAAQALEARSTWTEWSGLPGHARLYEWLRKEADWEATPVTTSDSSRGTVAQALESAPHSMSESYELPFLKHAPMGPTIAVADARPDGSIFIHTHNQNPQTLRGQIALMLGIPVEKIVVRCYSGAGHYGRSNGGNAGAEDEAVLLSMAVGQPVRVQWMRHDDMQWSTQAPPAVCDIRIGWDASGKVTAYEARHYMPAIQDDRLVGAVLAGLPTPRPPDVDGEGFWSTANSIYDPWVYGKIPNVLESGYGTFQIGQKESPLAIGMRDHSLRTPGQRQQNYPRELAFNEAAARAGLDAIEFRLMQTDNQRLIDALREVRDASGWQTRPAPAPGAASTGSNPVSGQGVSVLERTGSYWVCVCQVSVVPDSGKVSVNRCTMLVDPGIVINPLQLERQIQGGALMGLSHALFEETRFDEHGVTSRNWLNYPILTMADVPEMQVIIRNRPEIGECGSGSEAANALALSAVAAAFFDATGKPARRLPLTPAYVQSILQA